MAAQQADISPHRVLSQGPQQMTADYGELMVGTQPDLSLPPVTEQRIPTALAQMIQQEQKAGAGRNQGIVRRRTG